MPPTVPRPLRGLTHAGWAGRSNSATTGVLGAMVPVPAGCWRAGIFIKNRLKSIQYRPALIAAFLAQTGLTLEPEPQ
jgi:hypothetical protein